MHRVIFAALFFYLGVAGMANEQAEEPSRLVEGVSRELARHRAAQMSDVRYRLHLDLAGGAAAAARIQGREEIELKLASVAHDVILDFRDLDSHGKGIEGAVRNVTVNGQPAAGLRQTGGHIVLPARQFNIGENTIRLEFETGLAPAGRPVIRYQDADDGSRYIYTLLVPMDAHLAFPCFDQPDLKARFQFSASIPSDWTIVSNSPRVDGEAKEGDRILARFDQTPPISTYLFAFAAGPFRSVREPEGAGRDGGPLRLLVRRSQVQRLAEHQDEVFRLTRAGMKHFVEYFDHPFPFAKYDQVLIPGFAYGGMEHAGATFLREDAILFRTAPTRSDRLGRAALLLHELAHQWFGDLVTMRWFDDLWLKEGFANYMASHAMATLYDPDEIWKRFYQSHKPLAYGIDATRGATPIYQEVRNLKDAKSAYGAIVYQKAPSLLHALSFLIGEAPFRDGVRGFLKQHAYANAEWNDLIGAFEKASNQRLTRWANAWVKRRGMPEVRADWRCDDRGAIERFELRQHDVQGEGRAWPVKTQVLLAYDDAAPVRITAYLDGARAVVAAAVGRKCPAYVFANDRDYGYGRFLLDARSRDAVLARIGEVKDAFLRTMLWGALWDAVREAELKPLDYVEQVMKSLPAERDEALTQSLLARAAHAWQRYLGDAQRAAVAPRLESLLAERMMNAEDAGARITYFRAFRHLAMSAGARAQLKDMLAGKLVVPGVELKPLDRWQILARLLAAGDADAPALFAAERTRDASDDGRKQAYIAEAARADEAVKRRYFADYLTSRAVPEDWIEGSLAAFNAWNQPALTRPYLRPALDALPQVKRERKIFFVLAWLNAFIGGQQNQAALDEVRAFLKAAPIERDLELKVLEVMDELERTVRIQSS
jgi:aminopeptidase N